MEWVSAIPAALVRMALCFKILVYGPAGYKRVFWFLKS